LPTRFPGLFVYFYYGIKHSTLEAPVDEDERIELKIKSQPKPQNRPQVPPPTVKTTPVASSTAKVTSATTAVGVVDEKAEPKRPTNLEPLPANNDSNLFVSPSAFPKWED
jgi:hypothetical protein